jgi:hypothetical protein
MEILYGGFLDINKGLVTLLCISITVARMFYGQSFLVSGKDLKQKRLIESINSTSLLTIQTISTNDSKIKSMAGIHLNLGSLEVSSVEIDEISFSNFCSDFDYLGGNLKNVTVRFECKAVLNWKINYNVKFLEKTIEAVDEGGSVDLFNFDTGFINADTSKVDPGKMRIILPKLNMKYFKQDLLRTDTSSSLKITSDKMELNDIAMDETVVTNSSPALFGGTIPIKNPFGPQNISISNTKMNDFSVFEIKIPPFDLTNLDMQGIEVQNVVSDNLEVKGHAVRESSTHHLLNLVSLWSTLNITVTMKADKVEYTNLKGNIRADKAIMKGMTMDLNLKNIQIKDLKINQFDIPDIGVGL